MNQSQIVLLEMKILHALTEHDRRQSRKPGHNRYALGIYCEALNSWRKDKDTPAEPYRTLARYFCTCQDNGIDFSIRSLDKAIRACKSDARLQPTEATV